MLSLLPSFSVFVGLLLLLFLTVNTLIFRFFEDEMRDSYDWIILFFVLSCSEVLLILGVAGFSNHLNLLALTVGIVACFCCTLPWGILTAERKLRHLLFRHEERDLPWAAVLGWIFLFGLVELFNAFLQTPWEYDTLAYHLPMAVEWMRAGSLWKILYPVWGGPLGYYPGNHELLLTFFMLPFGSDVLVNLFNFFVAVVAIITVYKILRAMGVAQLLAWTGAALVMAMPLFLRQVGTSQVDLLMASALLMCFYYLLRSEQRADGKLLLPVLLSMALALGTKYLSVVYLIPALVLFFMQRSFWKKNHPFWPAWFFLILGTLGTMFYWRNLLVTGNPFFPAELKFGSSIIFEGYQDLTERIRGLSLWQRFSVEDGAFSTWFATLLSETGWYFYLTIVAYGLLVLELITKLFSARLKFGEGRLYTVMLFFFPLYWYLYLITPYTASMMSHNIRYAMPWLLLSMIMVAFVISKLKVFSRLLTFLLIPFLWWQFFVIAFSQRLGDQPFLEMSFISLNPWLFFGMMGVLLLAGFFFFLWKRRHVLRFPALLLCLGASLFFLNAVIPLRNALQFSSLEHKYSFPLIKAFEWIDARAGPGGVVAGTLNPLYYPLYGKNFSRTVKYVNINACERCDYFDYEKLQSSVRDGADYDAWRKNLKTSHVDFLVLGYSIPEGLQEVTPYELAWTAEHPKDFEKVFEKEGVFVYRPKY